MTFQLRTRKRARNESQASPDAVAGEIHGLVLGGLHDAFSPYARHYEDVHSEMIEIVPIMVQMPRTFVNQSPAFPRVAAVRVRLRPGYLPRPKSRRDGDAEWVGSGPRCSAQKIEP